MVNTGDKAAMEAAWTEAVQTVRDKGGYAFIARALGTSKQNVHQKTICPPHWAIAVERITGVSRHKLRPDIFETAAPTAG